MKIRETVVVEGRDDEAAVLRALDANVICTHGYGITQETLELTAAAYGRTGIVIFTDPDHAGLRIRERLTKLFPDAKQAFLTKAQAEKDGDIGIENASPEDIVRALAACGCCIFEGDQAPDSMRPDKEAGRAVTMEDLIFLGLAGGPGSAEKRGAVGGALGIGSANSKTFLKRMNYMGIGLEELEKACRK